MKQIFLSGNCIEEQLLHIMQDTIRHRIMLVAGNSYCGLPVRKVIEGIAQTLGIELVRFPDFSPNPAYREVESGVECYRDRKCEGLLAVGGGSAMDVAKCIKLFSGLTPGKCYLEQEVKESTDVLITVPTTAGSGSESTQFAVLYKDGVKYSVDSEFALPQYVILNGENLLTLPLSSKKVTWCDALSHAIESYWSLKATDESKELAKYAISLLLDNMEAYWANDLGACEKVLEGANLAGQAINITRTTAAHAMSYKFTSLYGIPHGYAVMLCLPEVWQYMQEHLEDCRDERGRQYLTDLLEELSRCLEKESPMEAISFLKELRKQFSFKVPGKMAEEQIEMMAKTVNVQRLDNFPIVVSRAQIREIYRQIMLQ